MSGNGSPTLDDAPKQRRDFPFLPPEDKSKEINIDASTSPSYLPCGLKRYDSDSFVKDYDKIPLQLRQSYANKIIGIMSKWADKRDEPMPLVFQIQESGDIVLLSSHSSGLSGEKGAPKDDINEKSPRQYDPHFWIPDACLIEINDQEKAFRREFFAAGCLIYQILKTETVWQGFLDVQAQALFERGVYPSDVKKLSHWRVILSYWSWEYVAEVNKQLAKKKALRIAKNVAIGTVAVGGTVALTAILSPLILPALGFGSAGVGAGSIAAGWQSAIGIVEAGSLFALCQSAGAGGAAGAAAIAAAALGGTGTVAAAGVVAGTTAGIENGVLRDEDLFALFLQVVRKAPQPSDESSKVEANL